MTYKKRKFRFFHQLESVDCGPACLAMVSSYYGGGFSVKQIKELSSITRMGVAVQDIVEGARKIGLEATAVKLSLTELEQIPLPAILFWKQDHFVVLYRVEVLKNNRRRYCLADPGYGRVKLEEEAIVAEWMGTHIKGVAILIQPINKIAIEFRQQYEPFLHNELVREVKSFLVQHKYKYFFSFSLLLVGLITNWILPIVFQKTIDKGIVAESIHVVWVLLFAQFVLFISNFSAQLVSDLLLTKLNFNLSILLKDNFLRKLLRLPINYFDTRLNSDTLQRVGDQHKIQSFLTWKVISLVLTALNLIVFSCILFHLNVIVFFMFVTLSLISILWVTYFLKRRSILEYALFIKQSENSNSMYEFVMNMPEIKVSSAQNTSIEKIVDIQHNLNKLELRSLFLNMYQIIGANFMSKAKELLSIALCAFLIIHHKMSIGTLLSISYILGQLSVPILNFVNNIGEMQDAKLAQQRVNDVYYEKDENTGSKLIPIDIQSVDFRNVSFKYPGSFNKFVINDINLSIEKNKVTAIVGTSGSGKTTLLKLLLAYYIPQNGGLKIGEIPIESVNVDWWRQKCGTVLQDGHLFATTIAQNIAIADRDIDIEKLDYACRIACLDEFISQLPMGVNTKVGSVGIQLSGGQRQRILIARAVYKNPDFLFFDEATSSLDANNEQKIMHNLHAFFKSKTVVIIAHRLSTVKNADQIIVLDKGEVAEIGNHESLTRKKGKYYDLVKNQLELGD